LLNKTNLTIDNFISPSQAGAWEGGKINNVYVIKSLMFICKMIVYYSSPNIYEFKIMIKKDIFMLLNLPENLKIKEPQYL